MVMHLVPKTDSVLFDPSMSTNVKDCRKFLVLFPISRKIQVSRDVKTGAGLVVKFLNDKSIPLELARNGGLQVGTRSVGRKPEHLSKLLPIGFLHPVPISLAFDFRQKRFFNLDRPLLEVVLEHVVAFSTRNAKGENQEREKKNK